MTTFIIVAAALIALQIATDRLVFKQKKIHQVDHSKKEDSSHDKS